MSCFDTIKIYCPKCLSIIIEQSKADKCILKEYTLDNAPLKILADIDGNEYKCNKCGIWFKIETEICSYVKSFQKRC